MAEIEGVRRAGENGTLEVLLTVDTEVWPLTPHWRETSLSVELERYIDGRTSRGEYGLAYQLGVLRRYGLKAVFLVESLFAEAVGPEPLQLIVRLIQEHGQEIQLHMHTEWLELMPNSLLPGRTGQNCKDFSEGEQTLLIARALRNLQSCGTGEICAFRAGNYGANFDTLRALRRNGIRFDTSHNTCYLDSTCDMRTSELLMQPQAIEGVYEFPVSFFRDRPGHFRHAQVCACSAAELEHALEQAWQAGWRWFVIVSHNFELLKRPIPGDRPALVDRVLVRRFERLCQFLANHRDRFRTVGFRDIDAGAIAAPCGAPPLASGVHRTLWRSVEQLAGRLL